jgi:site-specific DNA-methyltransferase (adenine-specific)
VQLASTSERKFFQAQKPVALIEKLILDTTIAGELVVDFCAGSGTTGIAAVKNKRRAILFEKDLGTCKIARARLEGGGEI